MDAIFGLTYHSVLVFIKPDQGLKFKIIIRSVVCRKHLNKGDNAPMNSAKVITGVIFLTIFLLSSYGSGTFSLFSLISLASIFAIIIALIALVLGSWSSLGISDRKVAAIVLAVSFLVFMVNDFISIFW